MGLRTLVAADGTEWNVWDIAPASTSRLKMYSVDLARGWLCFDCGSEKRRIAPPPEQWEQMSDAELEACLRSAEPVKRRGAEEPAPGG